MTNSMLQLENYVWDTGGRQGGSYSHHNSAAATTVEVVNQLPVATRIVQTRPLAKTSEGSGSRIDDNHKTTIRNQPQRNKKPKDGNLLRICTAIKGASAVKTDVGTSSFKGGWRRRNWKSNREKMYSRKKIKNTQTTDSAGLGESQKTSPPTSCQTETAEQLDGTQLTPRIVVLAAQDGSSIKDERTTIFRRESSVCETSSVEQFEREQTEAWQDFDRPSFSDVSWDILSTHGDTEMESCEYETQMVSESELSDTSNMEGDSYWEWNRERRQFQHWDELRRIYIYCPRQFL